jgi:hypothetical protein
VDWETIQTALTAWMTAATNLPVIWDLQAAVYNNKPVAEMRIFASQGVGTDELRRAYDGTAPAGSELQYTVSGHRIFTVGCKVRSRDNRPGYAAPAYLERARTSLTKPSVIALFQNAEIAIIGAEAVQDLSGWFQDRQESFASMDVIMSTVVNDTDSNEIGTYINTVEISSNVVDVSGVSISNTLQLVNEEIP